MSSNTSTAAANSTSGLQSLGTGALAPPSEPLAALCTDGITQCRVFVGVGMLLALLIVSRAKDYLWHAKKIARRGVLRINLVTMILELGMLVPASMAYYCNPPTSETKALVAGAICSAAVSVETVFRGLWVDYWSPARAEKKKAKVEGEEMARWSPLPSGDAAGPQGSMRRRNVT